jgi:hypothetical protein
MNIGVLSDLYIDEMGALPKPTDEPDIMILAGNIARGVRGLAWAQKTFDCPVVYILGNYSYHGFCIADLEDELRSMAWGTNVHILQNETMYLRGVRFIGSTLWTDFNLFGTASAAMLAAEAFSDDYKLIVDKYGNSITPVDTLEIHHRDVAYLRRAAREPYDDGHTVIVTHHAPSIQSVPPRLHEDPRMAWFASALDELVAEADAMIWIHGSESDSVDYTVLGTRVISNPRGKQPDDQRREVGQFKPGFTFTM